MKIKKRIILILISCILLLSNAACTKTGSEAEKAAATVDSFLKDIQKGNIHNLGKKYFVIREDNELSLFLQEFPFASLDKSTVKELEKAGGKLARKLIQSYTLKETRVKEKEAEVDVLLKGLAIEQVAALLSEQLLILRQQLLADSLKHLLSDPENALTTALTEDLPALLATIADGLDKLHNEGFALTFKLLKQKGDWRIDPTAMPLKLANFFD